MQLLEFMPKYNSFENLASISECAFRGVRMTSILSPWGKESICAISGILANGHTHKFHAKYGNFENHPLSRKPLHIEQKYAEFQCPGIERECMSLLLALWPISKLVVKQSAKAHGPLVRVTGHFETSAPNYPNMTLNTHKGTVYTCYN